MNYQSFAIRNKRQWDAYIFQSTTFESYQTWSYHLLQNDGEPVLFVYEEEQGIFIALPLIKRKIQFSDFYDLTSVYGYSGPISNMDFAQITSSSKVNFKRALESFMFDERCVCIFSRLHPFMNQNDLLSDIGNLKANGSTIYMNLKQPLSDQVSNYEKRLARQIRSLRKKDYVIREATSREEVDAFTRMYTDNMDRLNAETQYYYDTDYFISVLNIEGFNNKLILVYDQGEMICGALIMASKYIIRNHLSATSSDYLKESPSKLLTDEISRIGRELGVSAFHLGGGVGGREDSLFKFKRYFSDQLLPDFVWCYTFNEQVYNELLAQRELTNVTGFFPAYRQNTTTHNDLAVVASDNEVMLTN